jgi:hypothetical protein
MTHACVASMREGIRDGKNINKLALSPLKCLDFPQKVEYGLA